MKFALYLALELKSCTSLTCKLLYYVALIADRRLDKQRLRREEWVFTSPSPNENALSDLPGEGHIKALLTKV